MKENERKKGRKREITSPGSGVGPTDGTSRALGCVHTQASRRYLFIEKFSSPWRKVSPFLWKCVIMLNPFFLTFLEMSEGFEGLCWSWSSNTVHASFSTSFVHLYYVVLVSRSQNKDVGPRKGLPDLHIVPLSSQNLLFLTLCYYEQSLVGSTDIWVLVFETYTLSPLYSRHWQYTGKYFWLIFDFDTFSPAEKQSRVRLIIMHILNKKVYTVWNLGDNLSHLDGKLDVSIDQINEVIFSILGWSSLQQA